MRLPVSSEKLERYAGVLVDFALGGGEGIKPGDVVYLQYDSPALPLALSVYRLILKKGGHPIVKGQESDFTRAFYELADDRQLEFFPKKYTKSLVDTIDHRIYLIATKDPFYLKGIDPGKIMLANKSTLVYRRWLDEKEDRGRLTWTLALYGTPGMAREAGLTLSEYWQEITRSCFLDEKDPVHKWKQVFSDIEGTIRKLNKLPIDKLHVTAKDTDLWLTLGEKRKWMGGSGRNIPSFEIFTSPDWRGTEGMIFFDFPLYRYGNIIRDIHLEFRKGKVVSARAAKNEKLLQELIRQKNADKVGEYSLTDVRFSRINRFMANTLYDENYGGRFGNTHLALGTSYHDTYDGDARKLNNRDWQNLGFNESPEHTDIIAKQDRTVEAILKDGTRRTVYRQGRFSL